MILVSHRGPIGFTELSGGGFETRRGGGGLVSALRPLIEDRGEWCWIAAAIGEGDRAAIASGAATVTGFDLDLVAPDPEIHRLAYDVVSNATLWFLFHDLFDLPRRPRFDHRFRAAWNAYRAVNEVFADAVCDRAAHGDIVLTQDLHFLLLPGMLRARRPDLRLAHFTHTPFCGPDAIRILPHDVAAEILESMSAVPAGFHTERWAKAYRACVAEILGTTRAPAATFVTTFGPDVSALKEVAESDAARAAGKRLASQIGDRSLIFRTDRIELSKNIPRGFLAFDRLLEARPEWRNRVVFAAFVYPSRESLPEYLAYRQEIEHTARRVNERWASGSWLPILLDTRDDFPRSVAGFERADVLFVNPLRDGLNLVAKEGPLLSARDVVVCLSRGAGAFDELRDGIVEVHPFDIEQNMTALHDALSMAPAERARRAALLRTAAGANPATAWLDEQVRAAS